MENMFFLDDNVSLYTPKVCEKTRKNACLKLKKCTVNFSNQNNLTRIQEANIIECGFFLLTERKTML